MSYVKSLAWIGRVKDYKAKIKANVTVTPAGCWEWNLYRLPQGYGRTGYNGRNMTCHRLAWTVFRAPIAEGMDVLHRCDNPPCCNPEHLFLGTARDNMRDAIAKGRSLGRFPAHAVTKQRIRKLTHEQVDEIKSSSEPTTALAARFGCSYHNVYMIRNGLRKVAPRR